MMLHKSGGSAYYLARFLSGFAGGSTAPPACADESVYIDGGLQKSLDGKTNATYIDDSHFFW